MNIVEPIFAQCRNKPSELALCAPGTEFSLVSYARLQRSVDNICGHLIAVGIVPHSRIAVLIEDPIFHAMIVIALTRLGIITVSAGNRRVQWPFKLDCAIADRQYESLAGETVLLADAAWTGGDDRPLADKHVFRAAPDDLCRLFLTSGNDRRQTAIAMSHRMLATRLDQQKLFLGPRAPFCNRTYLDLPLARPLGFQVMLGTLWRGGALVMTSDERKTLAALCAYKVQNVVAAPRSLLKFADTVETSPAFAALTAAFFVRGMGQELDWVRARLCSNLSVGYVASDATMVASMPAQLASANPGAVGYVLPGVQVEIVDEQGRPLLPEQGGYLRIRSEHGVSEYFDDPDATRQGFRNGWFYPGERGHLTTDNVLVLSNAATEGATTDIERVE